MKVFAFCLLFLFTLLANAATKTVVGEGDSFTCYKREESLKLAQSAADSDGRDACNALGADWRYSRREFAGYEQCRQCGTSKEYICYVTKATYQCTDIAKEKAEKPKKQQEQNKSVVMDNADQYVNKQNELLKNQKSPKDPTSKTNANDKAEKAPRIAKRNTELGKQNAVDSDDPFAELDKPNAKQTSKQGKLDDAFASLDTTNQQQSSDGITGNIDQSFEEIELHKLRKEMIAARMITEREKNKQSLVKICQSKMNNITSCYEQAGCNDANTAAQIKVCESVPERPYSWSDCMEYNRICIGCTDEENMSRLRKKCSRYSDNLALEWDAKWKATEEICRKKKNKLQVIKLCHENNRKQCNPHGIMDESSCMESEIVNTKPPTEKEVREMLQKEWNVKSAAEKKRLTGNPNRVPRMNFLE